MVKRKKKKSKKTITPINEWNIQDKKKTFNKQLCSYLQKCEKQIPWKKRIKQTNRQTDKKRIKQTNGDYFQACEDHHPSKKKLSERAETRKVRQESKTRK